MKRLRLRKLAVIAAGFIVSVGFFGTASGETPAKPAPKSIFSDDPDPNAKSVAPPLSKPAEEAPRPVAPHPLPQPEPVPAIDALGIDAVAKAAAKAEAAQHAADIVWAKAAIDARRHELAELSVAQKAAAESNQPTKAAAIAEYARGVQAEMQSIIGYGDQAEPGAPIAGRIQPPAARAHGKMVADSLLITADDFVVDIYLNGRRIPDGDMHLEAEIFGATVMQVHAEIHEGDWLVFNVANDRFRWGGSYGFAAAGMTADGKTAFVSETQSGSWSTCERIGEVPRFIAEPLSRSEKAVAASKPWKGCTDQMRKRCDWTGETIWGSGPSRNVWIKYVVPGRHG